MTDRHDHLDEGTIHAWLDGALPPDESQRVESLATACTECAALVAEARGLVAASSRILSSLDAVPGGVIPGVESGTDQLAALRARRRETSRRWWNDRRIVAAASLVIVAGLSTVVWRSASNNAIPSAREQDAIVAQQLTDSAMPTATAPASVPSELTARDARAGAAAPLPSPVPSRLATTRKADSLAEPRIVAADAALSRTNVAANESRRADSNAVAAKSQLIDSTSVQRAQRSAFEVQLQQGAAPQGQQALRQRAEQSRPAAPPPALASGSRLGAVVTTGVGAGRADAMAPSAGCYQLRLPGPQDRNAVIIADSVQLLNEPPMELSDPTWYRARAARWADTALVWRSVDSTTVELRSRIASNPLAVRFSIAGPPLPLTLDMMRDRAAAVAVAVRIRCP